MSAIAKPQLRGLFASQIKRQIVIATVLATVAATSWKFLVLEEKKKAYAEFYKTYDADADYKRMFALGLFQDRKK